MAIPPDRRFRDKHDENWKLRCRKKELPHHSLMFYARARLKAKHKHYALTRSQNNHIGKTIAAYLQKL